MMHDWGWSPWMGDWMMGIGFVWLTTVLVYLQKRADLLGR
jgi:hypothetical protein